MTTTLIDEDGLRVAVVTAAEAASRSWAVNAPEADVVRVVNPGREDLSALDKAGFVLGPSWITWLAEPGPDTATFLGRIPKSERSSMRQSCRDVRDRGIDVRVRPALNEATFDEFMDLYAEQISAMRNGVLFAARWRETVLAQPNHFFVVRAAAAGGPPIGMCICTDRPGDIAVRIAFAAQSPAERTRGRLVRAMYLAAFEEARGRGRSLISLGSDPGLYGHVAQPGLFRFKARMGFRPVPTRFLDEQEPDRAELVLSLARLTDPALLIGYAAPPPDGAASGIPEVSLRVHLLTSDGTADPGPYRAAGMAEPTLRTVTA